MSICQYQTIWFNDETRSIAYVERFTCLKIKSIFSLMITGNYDYLCYSYLLTDWNLHLPFVVLNFNVHYCRSWFLNHVSYKIIPTSIVISIPRNWFSMYREHRIYQVAESVLTTLFPFVQNITKTGEENSVKQDISNCFVRNSRPLILRVRIFVLCKTIHKRNC